MANESCSDVRNRNQSYFFLHQRKHGDVTGDDGGADHDNGDVNKDKDQ